MDIQMLLCRDLWPASQCMAVFNDILLVERPKSTLFVSKNLISMLLTYPTLHFGQNQRN